MKIKYIYLLISILLMSSCVKEFDEPCAIPASGIWVAHDKDGFSTDLIELKQGKFIQYALTGKNIIQKRSYGLSPIMMSKSL
jgi:hypothetical protein